MSWCNFSINHHLHIRQNLNRLQLYIQYSTLKCTMMLTDLHIYILELIIPSYLPSLKDKLNYFNAINIKIPERFFIKSVLNTENKKSKILHEFRFININFLSMSENCMRHLKYHHWVYISGVKLMSLDFIKKYQNKIIPSALVNNKKCFNVVNLWQFPVHVLNFRFKIITCAIC